MTDLPSLIVAPIVEGHGEYSAVPILVRRICDELLNGVQVNVLRPIRQHRDRLLRNKDDCLTKSIDLATGKLRQAQTSASHSLILVIADADDDCAAQVGPEVLALSRQIRADQDVGVVLAVWEYETWFVAAADSLDRYLKFNAGDVPPDPEMSGASKGWVQRHWRGTRYSETIDQPKLTAAMNLASCRSRSPSFDKLCRELGRRTALLKGPAGE